ncbi:MAG: DUF1156 domain-containing protein [Alphaproteobacteria bacterium]
MTTPKKKLIEVALPLEAINAASSREKSIRHGHPSTLHLWWARRPLAACRAVLFGQLVDDPSAWPERFPTAADQQRERARLHRLIETLVTWEASTDEHVLDAARFEIARSLAWGRGEEPPTKPADVRAYLLEHSSPVYDPFCGGGSIPLEAQRLGLKAIASDLNPVAVMITKALVEFPPKFAGLPPVNPDARAEGVNGTWQKKGAEGLAEDVRWYGRWMRDEAERRIGHLYPKAKLPDGGEATVIAWLWARTVKSPNPAARGARVPLVASFMLSTKSEKEVWVEVIRDGDAPDGYCFAVRTRAEHGKPPAEATDGTVNRRGARCALTDVPIPFSYIRTEGKAGRMGVRLFAVVAEGQRSRVYLSPTDEHVEAAAKAEPEWRPDQPLPDNPRDFKTPNYGLTTFGDLFTDRQLVALTTFSDLVGEARAKVLADARAAGRAPDPTPLAEGGSGAQAYADAVAVYLGLVASKEAVFVTTQARWRAGEGKSAPGFGRQALPMVWDFTEVNPFAEAGGELLGIVKAASGVLSRFPIVQGSYATQADATQGTPEDGVFINTDPPYYDNIGYADLSDYFYVWMRRSMRHLFPQEFSTVLVPKAGELVATPYRFDGGANEAERFFLDGMTAAIGHLNRSSINGVPVTIYYAFKQSEIEREGVVSTGWATFLEGVVRSGFQVDGTWPVRTENRTRQIAMGTNALASSIVLVCRKRADAAPTVSRAEFLRALRRELPPALATLQQAAIAPVDMAQASIGPGMAVFSRYAAVLEADDAPMTVKTALALINQFLDEYLAEQEGEFDSHSRFAITWFEQHGFAEGKYGEAEVLAQARDVAVAGVVAAGLIRAGGGKVRLLRRDELDQAWDIRTDDRVTVWECCQHLIRRHDGEGVDGAARLLKSMGHYGELARDLAYRLFQLCERKKWAEEARAYNALVVAWPDIVKRLDEVSADPLPGRDGRQAEFAL